MIMGNVPCHDRMTRRSLPERRVSALALMILSLSLDTASALMRPMVHRPGLERGSLGRGSRSEAACGGSSRSGIGGERVAGSRWGRLVSRSSNGNDKEEPESTPFERFPAASTLIRPKLEEDPKLFLDATRETFQKVKKRRSLTQRVGTILKPWRLPFGRIPKQTKLLTIVLKGEIPSFSPEDVFGESSMNLIELTRVLRTAAHDRRIESVLLKIDDGSAGGISTMMELRRAMDYFRQSGKPLWGFAARGISAKELYLLGGCTKSFALPDASVNLLGFSTGSVFFRDAFDKLGIEPQVRRIGEFKSFGDRFSRSSMSAANREVTEYLLKAMSDFELKLLAHDVGKSEEQVETLYNEGVVSSAQLKEFGFVDELLYPDELYSAIAVKTDKRREEKALRRRTQMRKELKKFERTGLRPAVEPHKAHDMGPKKAIDYSTYLTKIKYREVAEAPGTNGATTKIAVICAEGQIVGDDAKPSVSTLRPKDLGSLVKQVMKNSDFEGVVIRINSPGGDAYASDLMYREVLRMRETGLTVVASIGDCAASGGYYLAMGCEKILCDDLSITGSIGVVLGKLSFGKLLKKIGLNVERISRGKYAELFSVERSFNPDEDAFWSHVAMESYSDFVSKAARSRRMPVEDMNRRAQGRVWTGAQAKELGLVDEIGGLQKAMQVCHDMVQEKRIAREKLEEALSDADASGKGEAGEDAEEETGEKRFLWLRRILGRAPKESEDEEKDDDRLGLFDGDIPVGPLGFPEEQYTELEAKIVNEARAEVAKKKAETPDDFEVVNIEPRFIEKWRLFLSSLNKFDTPELPSLNSERSIMRMSKARAAASAASVGEGALVEALGDLTEQSCRPMAVLDDNIARMIPSAGVVPKSLRRLGVGPALNIWIRRWSAITDNPVQLLGLWSLKQFLDTLGNDEGPGGSDG